MNQDGIEVRGITQPDGTAEFNEVFFDDARCPKENVVGGVNNGWVVANTTLGSRAGQLGHDQLPPLRAGVRPDGRSAPATTARSTTRSIRQRLARYHTKIADPPDQRAAQLIATLHGRKDPGVAALGATNKMFWSEMHREAMELALDIFGARCDARRRRPRQAGNWPGARRDTGRDGYQVSPMMSSFFFSRSETIWGGTAEIQRNIVGERVLGLPGEPS